MLLRNMILVACILASLVISWLTFVQHGGCFALIRLLGCMALLYCGTAIFLGQTPEARIFGLLVLIPGLRLFLLA